MGMDLRSSKEAVILEVEHPEGDLRHPGKSIGHMVHSTSLE